MKTKLLRAQQCFRTLALVLLLSLIGGQEAQAQNVTRIVTDFNGYWNSTNGNTTPRPNLRHNVLAFGHGGVVYSTGANDATLLANNVVFTPAQFRALPIGSIPGNTGSGANNYLIMGNAIDGNPSATNYLAPGVNGVTAATTLIDGIKGLDIGTGVTNIRDGMTFTMPLSNVSAAAVTDNVPDFLLTQIADPTGYDTFEFVDAEGVRVGTVYNANFVGQSSLGKYDIDLFTLAPNTPYATATPTGNGSAGNSFRDIYMLAVKFSDFGINATNYTQIAGVRWNAKGNSDPGFLAYNEESFLLGAPRITVQPQGSVVCTGGNYTFSVTAVGENLSYQWLRNGVPIDGATNSEYEVTGISAANSGAYTVSVSNEWGTVLSEAAYLNTIFLLQPQNTVTCTDASATLMATAEGNNPAYQWYSNTTNSNVGGTPIPGETNNTLSVSFPTTGQRFYYVIIAPEGNSCAALTSNVATVNVTVSPVAGIASTPFTVACQGKSVTLSVSGHVGSVQWEVSTSSPTGGFNNVNGATGVNYTTGALSATRHYRAKLTSGGCTTFTNAVTVTVTTNNTWRGTANSDWNNPANWSCGEVPTALRNVVISPTFTENYPVISAAAFANNLTVQQDASLTVNAAANFENVTNSGVVNVNNGAVLTVASSLVNNAPAEDFTIADNAGLLQLSTNVNVSAITVQKNSSLLYRQDYTLWASPVIGQNLQEFSPVTLPNRFYTYNPSTDLYASVDPATTDFETGVSYLIRMPNQSSVPGYNNGSTPINFEGTFTGIPHNGTIELTLSTDGSGYNSVGNPYPSAINVADFFAANEDNIVDGSALYFWRKKNDASVSSYATLTTLAYTANNVEGGDTGTGYFNPEDAANWQLNVGQGFIVQVDNPSLVFNNGMRRGSSNGQFFRSAQNLEASRYWLNLSGGQAFSQLAVGYTPMGTLGLDYALDGKVVEGGDLTFYSVEDTNKFAIQARPDFASTDVVALGFIANNAGTYQISLNQFDGLFADQEIYLEDLASGTTHNLKEDAYSFSTEAGAFENRFRVVYQVTLGTTQPSLSADQVVVVSKSGRLDIHSSALQMNAVRVFDVRGRLLHQAQVNANNYSVNGIVADGVLLLQIETPEGTVNKKTIINAQ